MQKFYTASGNLTPYALACGYVEKFENANGRATLWCEHGVYHARGFDHIGRRPWEACRTLSAARAHFRQMRKQLQDGSHKALW